MKTPIPNAIRSRLEQGTFTRGVAVLVGGALGAQVVNALAAPFLTRLYSPAQLGQLGLFMAFVGVGATVVALRYEQTIVVAPSHPVAARLARLAAYLLVPVSAVLTAVLVVLVLAGIGGFDSLPLWAAVLGAISLVGMGVSVILRHWLIRMNRYDVIASVNIFRVAGRGVAQIGLGAAGFGIIGLLVGDLVGRVMGIGRMLRVARPRLTEALRTPEPTSSLQLGAEYAQFPLAGVPSSLINSLALYIPTPLLAATYGLTVAGLYALVQRVLEAPLLVVGSSVSDALLGRISKRARKAPERAERLFLRTALGLAVLAVPMGAAITLLAPAGFEFLFGSEWRLAGELAVAMVPWYMVALIVAPLGRVVLVYRGQVSKLIYDAIALMVAVASVTIAADRGLEPLDAVSFLSWGQAAAYAVYFVILYRMVRRSSRAGVVPTDPNDQ